jgi:hypothetical protein
MGPASLSFFVQNQNLLWTESDTDATTFTPLSIDCHFSFFSHRATPWHLSLPFRRMSQFHECSQGLHLGVVNVEMLSGSLHTSQKSRVLRQIFRVSSSQPTMKNPLTSIPRLWIIRIQPAACERCWSLHARQIHMPFSSYAICVGGNGCMPTLSDPPYPFNCLPKGLASSFEHYQALR